MVLDLESEVMRGLGSIPTGGNICHWIFCFHIVKPLQPFDGLKFLKNNAIRSDNRECIICITSVKFQYKEMFNSFKDF